jgi:hypothetical protein
MLDNKVRHDAEFTIHTAGEFNWIVLDFLGSFQFLREGFA